MGITINNVAVKRRSSLFLLLVPLFIAAGLCLIMFFQWKRFGVADKKSMSVENKIFTTGGEPQLLTRSIRIAQGDTLLLSQIAQAIDENGNDISSYLSFRCRSAKISKGRFCTEQAGIYEVEMQVKSPVSGKTREATIQILVDGRVRQ